MVEQTPRAPRRPKGVRGVLQLFFSFNGTSPGEEYVLVVFLGLGVLWVAGLLVTFLAILPEVVLGAEEGTIGTPAKYLLAFIWLVSVLAVSVRRARDIGTSTAIVFFYLVPLANLILALYLIFKPGKRPPTDEAQHATGSPP